MRKLVLYIACSVNGYIAKKDGSVDWLEAIPNPEQSDYGYTDFMQSIDTTIMGNATYRQIIDWGIEFPYKDKTNYVLSRNPVKKKDDYATFVSVDPTAFIRKLKQRDGKNIWLIGGGQVNSLLWNAGLIDEIKLFIMPLVLEGGIKLFEFIPYEKQLILKDSKSYESGVVELTYTI